jgi:NAD(P)-dependent dehydrogenase (short-subunit alcohol dehydrogenase family)
MDQAVRGERLAGKVALVTGAASGMGEATAELFAAQGARVALADLDDARLATVTARLRDAGHQVFAVRLDVGDPASWATAVAAVTEHFGPVTVLVNNAGIWMGGGVADLTLADWERVIRINQTGPFLGMQACIPGMRAAGGGAIVNISSRSGIVGSKQGHGYHATKAAVRVMTKQAALECAEDGIRVNSVHPGLVTTPMNIGADMSTQIDACPMRRSANPFEVAYASLFLASDEASFITGTELVVDGGRGAY